MLLPIAGRLWGCSLISEVLGHWPKLRLAFFGMCWCSHLYLENRELESLALSRWSSTNLLIAKLGVKKKFFPKVRLALSVRRFAVFCSARTGFLSRTFWAPTTSLPLQWHDIGSALISPACYKGCLVTQKVLPHPCVPSFSSKWKNPATSQFA